MTAEIVSLTQRRLLKQAEADTLRFINQPKEGVEKPADMSVISGLLTGPTTFVFPAAPPRPSFGNGQMWPKDYYSGRSPFYDECDGWDGNQK